MCQVPEAEQRSSVTRRLGIKFTQFGEKVSKNVTMPKMPNCVHQKTQFESQKHLNRTTFETLKYPQHITLSKCLFR
jgi:hypothetical protein